MSTKELFSLPSDSNKDCPCSFPCEQECRRIVNSNSAGVNRGSSILRRTFPARRIAHNETGQRRSLAGRSLARMSRACKMLLPLRQFGPQTIKIKIGKRFLGAGKISHRAIENRPRAAGVLPRLMMKRHRHLHQSLQMPPQRAPPRRFPPRIFERFVGVEEPATVKKLQPASKRRANLEGDGLSPRQTRLPRYSF